jgi:phage terminase large subunit
MTELQIPTRAINPVYRPFWNVRKRIELFHGGGGSGKSVFIAQRAIKDIMSIAGCNYLVITKIAVKNHNTTFAELCKVIYQWGISQYFDINRSVGAEVIECKVTGNRIIFGGVKDEKELEKIKGVTTKTGPITDIWFEEVTDGWREDFIQLNNVRLRGKWKVPKRFIGSFNPIDDSIWIHSDFWLNPPDGMDYFSAEDFTQSRLDKCRYFSLRTTYLDNEYYGADDAKELERLKDIDAYHYDVYVLGKWGSIKQARIFSNFKIHDFDVIDKPLTMGADWGFNDPAALVGSYIHEGDLWIPYEYYERGKTNSDLIADWSKHKNTHIIADSSEPARIKEFRNAGYRMHPAQKGAGSIKAGIDYLRRFPCIHIHKTLAPNVAREFGLYKYKETKTGIIDEPLDMDNHSIDGLRYAWESAWNKTRPEVNLSRRF